MVETLLDGTTEWLAGDGPECGVALSSRCRLSRNLASYPFPSQCSSDQKSTIEDQLVSVFESCGLMARGHYWSLSELDPRESRFLAERELISPELASAEGRRGVYISDDQSLSISINGENHLTICGLASGLRLTEVWDRVSLVDDTLAGVVDYAFNDRLGYLTSSIAELGTGLKASVVLHLPGLVMDGRIAECEGIARDHRHGLSAVFGPVGQGQGDLFRLMNTSTLGRSEAETTFHLKHVASSLIEKEKDARNQYTDAAPLHVEDRVGRALGLARGARFLAFSEALAVLSSLRLGVSNGVLDQYSHHHLNGVYMASQDAHIETKLGHECDGTTLDIERADLFRSRFS